MDKSIFLEKKKENAKEKNKSSGKLIFLGKNVLQIVAGFKFSILMIFSQLLHFEIF